MQFPRSFLLCSSHPCPAINILMCCMQVLDVGQNQLLNVSVGQLMASQISLFDMSLNSQLKIDPEELKSVKYVYI